MPSLVLAVAILFAPGVCLLASGLPRGWSVLAGSTAILAVAAAVHVAQAMGGSTLFVAPAITCLTAALVPQVGASGFAGLALAAGSGLALGMFAGLVDCAATGVRATGVALLWLTLAAALPAPPGAGPVFAEALGAVLLLVVLLLAAVRRAEAGSLAAAARMAAVSPLRSAAQAVPVLAVRIALGATSGLAAGLAAFAWSAAADLGGERPGAILLALALFAAAQLSGASLSSLLASCFLLLGVPALAQLVVPALPLGWLIVAAALVAVGLFGRGWPSLLRHLTGSARAFPGPGA